MKVFVTVYEHKHGTDVHVFDTFTKAQALKDEIGSEYWTDFSNDPQPEDPCGDAYFELASGYEFFTIDEVEVE